LFSLIIGFDVVRTIFTLGTEFLGAHFEEYYVITALLVVGKLTFLVWEKKMMISPVISEKFLCFL